MARNMARHASLLDRLRSRLARVIAPAAPRQANAYRGGAVHRLNATRVPANLSPNREIRLDGSLLRARARQLVRDNGYASGFVDDVVSQILGPAGLTLVPLVRDGSATLRKDVNTAIRESFAAWGDPECASLDGHDGWVDLQELALRTWVTDGEAFFRKIAYADNPHAFTLAPIDADQVDETFNREADQSGRGLIRMGVELDARGRPVAYHVWDRHPSEPGRTRVPLPASEVIHLFTRTRPGQVRGVTWFAPVISSAMQFDELTESELMTARVAAGSMGVITNNHPDAIAAFVEEEAEHVGEDGQPAPRPRQAFEVEPGTLQELNPGQELQAFAPAHPSPQYAGFAKVILRGQARGLRASSYNSLTGDLEGVNYSSLRWGTLRERDCARIIQRQLADHFARPVFRAWLPMALLTGALDLPGVADAYRAHRWKPRGWQSVDPAKEIAAVKERIALGITSRQRVVADEGEDWEEIFEELEAEQRLAAEHGIAIDGTASGSAAPAGAPADESRPPADADDADDAPAPPSAPRRRALRLGA